MKKTISILITGILCFYSVSVLSQAIQVDCTNETVGINCTPSTAYELKVQGELKVTDEILSEGTIKAEDNIWSYENIKNYGDISFFGTDNYIYGIENLHKSTAYGNLEFGTSTVLSITTNSATNALNVTGNVWVNGSLVSCSDENLKKDIKNIDGSQIIDRLNRVESKKYKFKNKNELKALHNSGLATFQLDTINIEDESENLFFESIKKDTALVSAFNKLDKVEKKNKIKKMFQKEVIQKNDFDEIIGDSLGVKIRVPKYNENEEHYGFIAQEVKEEFPELVVLDSSTNTYGVNYTEFIPLLLQAIKEQQKQIENQQQQIDVLQTIAIAHEEELLDINAKEDKLKSSPLGSSSLDGDIPLQSTLYQNTPNPFNNSTVIGYYLESDVQNAYISICNLNGIQLKKFELHQTGDGSITLERGSFQPGIYLYALVANGELIDSKKMMLSE